MTQASFLKSVLLLSLFLQALPAWSKDTDYLSLYVQLPFEYNLPKNLRNKKLKFEGNYRKHTRIEYRSKYNQIRFTPMSIGTAVLVIKNLKNDILSKIIIKVDKTNFA